MSHSFDVLRDASECIAPAADDDYFVDVAGLARLMRIAPATVYSDLSRSPWKLPPPCRPRGRRLLLWDRQAAIAWIKRFEEVRPDLLAHSGLDRDISGHPRKRDRPRRSSSVRGVAAGESSPQSGG